MDLIDVYVQEVTRRLPEKMREDITLELNSTIHDMLPEQFSKHDVKQVLEKLGNPAVLASRYKDRPMHLIGPKFFDMYISILKLVFPIAAIIVFILFVADQFSSTFGSETVSPMNVITIFAEAIWVLIGTFIQVFFWVTIVFIILDRTIESSVQVPLSISGKKWTPDDLDSVSYIPLKKRITNSEIWFSLAWTIIWVILYFNAFRIIGVFRFSDQASSSFAMPIFNQDVLMSYLAIIIIYIALELIRFIYMAVARQWTFGLAITNAIVNVASFVFLIIIASNANLFNPEFAPYIADVTENTLGAVNSFIAAITWIIIASVVVTGVISIYQGFRKANLKL